MKMNMCDFYKRVTNNWGEKWVGLCLQIARTSSVCSKTSFSEALAVEKFLDNG